MQQTLPETAQAAAAPHQPAKRGRKRGPTGKLLQVIELLESGACKDKKTAAERVGVSPTYIYRELKKPHVRVFCEQRARENLLAGLLRASNRMVELMDCDANGVCFDASRLVLATHGIKPATDAQVSVNVDIKAGYVIRLVDPDASGLTQPNNSAPAISTTYEDVTPRNVTDDVT